MKNFCGRYHENFNEIATVFNRLATEICKRYVYDNVEFYSNFFPVAQLRLILYDHDFEWLTKNPSRCFCVNITFEQNTYIIYKYHGLNLFKYFNSSDNFLLHEIPRYHSLLKNYLTDIKNSDTVTSFCKLAKKHGLFDLNNENSLIKMIKNSYFDNLSEDYNFPEIFNSMKDNTFQIIYSQRDLTFAESISDFTHYCHTKF